MSYVLEVTNINGEEVWYQGTGWYWTDADFTFHGAYDTEKEALTDYAWYVHGMLEQVNEFRRNLNKPKILAPKSWPRAIER